MWSRSREWLESGWCSIELEKILLLRSRMITRTLSNKLFLQKQYFCNFTQNSLKCALIYKCPVDLNDVLWL